MSLLAVVLHFSWISKKLSLSYRSSLSPSPDNVHPVLATSYILLFVCCEVWRRDCVEGIPQVFGADMCDDGRRHERIEDCERNNTIGQGGALVGHLSL